MIKEIRLGRRTTNTTGGMPIWANSLVTLTIAPLARRISLKIMMAQIRKASSRDRCFLAELLEKGEGKTEQEKGSDGDDHQGISQMDLEAKSEENDEKKGRRLPTKRDRSRTASQGQRSAKTEERPTPRKPNTIPTVIAAAVRGRFTRARSVTEMPTMEAVRKMVGKVGSVYSQT